MENLGSRISFEFPLGVFGNSSGWWPSRGIVLQRQADLAPRRKLKLQPCAKGVLIRSFDVLGLPRTMDIPFFIKRKAGDANNLGSISALSSGAGSALFKLPDHRTIKLKRCGVGDLGFVKERIYSNHSENIGDDDIEIVDVSYPGVMSINSAITELDVAVMMEKAGLSRAYSPLGLLIAQSLKEEGLPNSNDHPVAAVLMEVHSDLRLDELVYMCMTPLLSHLFEAKTLSYDPSYPEWGFFCAKGIALNATRLKWRHLSDRLYQIGLSAGSIYNYCHQLGLLRGFGSCWFGNEVIHPDGQISMVDFDGGAIELNHYSEPLRDPLRLREFAQYSANALLMLNTFRPTTLQLFGVDFVRGLKDGYECEYRPLPRQLMDTIMDDYIASRHSLWEGMGFSADQDCPLTSTGEGDVLGNDLIDKLQRFLGPSPRGTTK